MNYISPSSRQDYIAKNIVDAAAYTAHKILGPGSNLGDFVS